MNDKTNSLIRSAEAINTLRISGVLSAKQAKVLRAKLATELNEEIGYWNDKGDHIAEALNATYRLNQLLA